MRYRLFGREGVSDRELQKLIDLGMIEIAKQYKDDPEMMA